MAPSCSKEKTQPASAAADEEQNNKNTVQQQPAGSNIETYSGAYTGWQYRPPADQTMELYVETVARGKTSLFSKVPIRERWGDTVMRNVFYKWKTNSGNTYFHYFERLEGVNIVVKNDSLWVKWYINDELASKGTGGIHEIYRASFVGRKISGPGKN